MRDLLAPFPFLFVVCAIALVWLWRRMPEQRRRLLWIVVPFAILWIGCMPWTGYLAIGSLEWGYPPEPKRLNDVRVIVVLSGGIAYADRVRPKAILTEDSTYRCLHAAELYHNLSGTVPILGIPKNGTVSATCTVLLSGGKVDKSDKGPQLAEVMSELMQQLGVRKQDIVLEHESTSTYENAVNSAKMLKDQLHITRVVLVTDAAHLPRATRCFQKQGIEVVPSGCRYRATAPPSILTGFIPQPTAARGTQYALHEWMGLLSYWVLGRI